MGRSSPFILVRRDPREDVMPRRVPAHPSGGADACRGLELPRDQRARAFAARGGKVYSYPP